MAHFAISLRAPPFLSPDLQEDTFNEVLPCLLDASRLNAQPSACRIINTGSMHALVASPYKSAYNAAKHGIAGLTKTVGLELAQKGNITCNAICPGWVSTGSPRLCCSRLLLGFWPFEQQLQAHPAAVCLCWVRTCSASSYLCPLQICPHRPDQEPAGGHSKSQGHPQGKFWLVFT